MGDKPGRLGPHPKRPVEYALLRFIEHESIVDDRDATLDIVQSMAWIGPPRGRAEGIAEMREMVDGDGPVAEISDGLIEHRTQFVGGARVGDDAGVEGTPEDRIAEIDGSA